MGNPASLSTSHAAQVRSALRPPSDGTLTQRQVSESKIEADVNGDRAQKNILHSPAAQATEAALGFAKDVIVALREVTGQTVRFHLRGKTHVQPACDICSDKSGAKKECAMTAQKFAIISFEFVFTSEKFAVYIMGLVFVMFLKVSVTFLTFFWREHNIPSSAKRLVQRSLELILI